MNISIRSNKYKAIEILRNYEGINPFILRMKRDVILYQKVSLLTDFVADYIIDNQNRIPFYVEKTIEITDWYGEKLKDEYQIEFVPVKMRIISYLGETDACFHCVIKYRQNMEPMELFIPKKAVVGNFLVENDLPDIRLLRCFQFTGKAAEITAHIKRFGGALVLGHGTHVVVPCLVDLRRKE